MSRGSHEVDHIDPEWREGRDYQLICGLDTSCNKILRTTSENARKTNRFLPWRVNADELSSVPVDLGDICLFLDPDNGEWVLEEFMGEWWYEKTRKLCGNHIAGALAVESGQLEKARKKVDKPSQLRDARSRRDPKEHSNWGRTFAAITNTTLYKCLVTGYVSTAGPLSIYQRNRGIDTQLRVKLS